MQFPVYDIFESVLIIVLIAYLQIICCLKVKAHGCVFKLTCKELLFIYVIPEL